MHVCPSSPGLPGQGTDGCQTDGYQTDTPDRSKRPLLQAFRHEDQQPLHSNTVHVGPASAHRLGTSSLLWAHLSVISTGLSGLRAEQSQALQENTSTADLPPDEGFLVRSRISIQPFFYSEAEDTRQTAVSPLSCRRGQDQVSSHRSVGASWDSPRSQRVILGMPGYIMRNGSHVSPSTTSKTWQ